MAFGISQRWIASLTLAALLSMGAPPASATPTVAFTSAEEWKEASRQPIESANLMVRLPTSVSDGSFLTELFKQIPNRFPELFLNTLARGFHSSVLYLDGLTVDQLREFTRYMRSIPPETLQKFDLLKPVTVIDPYRPEFKVFGSRSHFLVLEPHPEFVEWQVRLWKMIEETGPAWIMKMHKDYRDRGRAAISEEAVHFSLVQWGGHRGPELSAQESADISERMRETFLQTAREMEARTGKSAPVLRFDWTEMPIQLAQPMQSFTGGPLDILAMRAVPGEGVRTSEVIRLRVKANQDGEQTRLLEAPVDAFIKKDLTAGGKKLPLSGLDRLGENRQWTPLPEQEFSALINDPRLKEAFEKGISQISPSWKPAAVPAQDPARAHRFFVGRQTHPQLEPEKTFEILELVRGMGFRSVPEFSIGQFIYASSARREIRNPSDYDLMINGIAWVPESVSSYEEAKAFAVRQMAGFIGQIRDADRDGRIAIGELRVGSNATMGILSEGWFEDGLNNPYLGREDINRGYYVDDRGRKWTVEELLALGDFTKLKLDYFSEGKRYPISMQLGLGFSWRGNVFHMNQNGLKGIQPNLRTAVYDGAESMAIAIALAKPYEYYVIQKPQVLARAIGDLRRTAHFKLGANGAPVIDWSPKLLKKIYNFLFLIKESELRIDEVFLKDVARELEKQGVAFPDLGRLIEQILKSINTPELAVLNALKRNVNDLREFNELRHKFTPLQWSTRVEETRQFLSGLESLLEKPTLRISPDLRQELVRNKSAFEAVFQHLTNSPDKAAVHMLHDKKFQAPLENFETSLGKLEGAIVSEAIHGISLDGPAKAFILNFLKELPRSYERYVSTRTLETPTRMAEIRTLLELSPAEPVYRAPKVVPLAAPKPATKTPRPKTTPVPKLRLSGCEAAFAF